MRKICRSIAASGLPQLFPSDVWVPIQLEVLQETLAEESTEARRMIRSLALREQHREAIPYLIQALSAADPNVRGDAIIGLEKAMQLTGEQLGYDSHWSTVPIFKQSDKVRLSRVVDAQQEAVYAWQKWWREECPKRFMTCGPLTEDPS